MVISLQGKSALYKGDLMMLEMVDRCNWTRPVYVATTVGQENYMNLGDNFVQEGLANRITPFTTNAPGAKNFDTKRTYDNVMHKFKFGGLDKPGLYLDETVMRMCYTHRRLMVQLAMNLMAEGDRKKAAEVLAYADKVIPEYNVPLDYASGSLDQAHLLLELGQKDKATEMIKKLWKKSEQYLRWYCSLNGSDFTASQRDCMLHFFVLQQCAAIGAEADPEWGRRKQEKGLEELFMMYRSKGGTLQP